MIFLFLLLISFATNDSSSDFTYPEKRDHLQFFGAVRTVYTYQDTQNRNGDTTTESALNSRIQLGFQFDIHDNISLRVRTAGRFATNQDQFRFILQDYTPGGGSYDSGTITIDEANLTWHLRTDVRVVAGRFQGRFPLAGFIPKGMDRYYAANLSISHTDGIWLRWDRSELWRTHFILSHNGTQGSTHAGRTPLTYSDPWARISYYGQLEHKNTQGFWVQRELSASYTPNTFYRNENHVGILTLTSRLMTRLPVELSSGELWAGGELGVIPIAPKPASAGIQVEENRTLLGSSSVAWQLSAYANDVFKNQRIGILYGQTEPHWVQSASFRPNNTMAEIRYRYTFSSSLNFEMRYRYRSDLFQRSNAAFSQIDRDFYARVTWRF